MPDPPAPLRFYGELAEWWPLVSPAEEYEEEAGFAATLIGLAHECWSWAAAAAAAAATTHPT